MTMSHSYFSFSAFETRSLPSFTRSYPRHFTFFVAHPIRSIQFLIFFVDLLLFHFEFRAEANGHEAVRTSPLHFDSMNVVVALGLPESHSRDVAGLRRVVGV